MGYHIMQIVHGGKVSRLHDLVIRGKTFAIVQQFETPCNRKAKNLLENLHDWRLIRESFSPRTICIIRYNNWLKSTLNNQSCSLSKFPTVCYLRVVGLTDVLLSIYSKRWYGCYSDIFKDSINHTH